MNLPPIAHRRFRRSIRAYARRRVCSTPPPARRPSTRIQSCGLTSFVHPPGLHHLEAKSSATTRTREVRGAGAPASLLDAGDGDGRLAPRGDEHGHVEDAVLLRADE